MIRTTTALTLAGALALSACSDPANMANGDSRAKQGAITGAIAGGIFGLSRGGDDAIIKGAVGAALGAAVGGAIGNQLDKQAGELRQDLGNDDVKIVNNGNELIVTMPQDILFATDSAVVNYGLQSDLRALAQNLQKYPDTTVDVVGHTDNSGAASYNQDLSARRASAVATLLIADGVRSSRIRAYGAGEDRPITSNLTPEGRAQNRRVEIIIRPTT
ncbi:MAG: OmpA family protein [Paracoccaceae bacterium]